MESLICIFFSTSLVALNYFGFYIFAHIRPATVDGFSPVRFNKRNICANSSSARVISSSGKKNAHQKIPRLKVFLIKRIGINCNVVTRLVKTGLL